MSNNMGYIRDGADQMLTTIDEANNLCMHAMYYYQHAAYSLDQSAYNYHAVDFSEQAMNNAVQQAQIGTDMIKSSFILQAQFGTNIIKSSFILNLSQQFPMLMTIPIIPSFPSEVNNRYRQNSDHQQVELLYRNLNRFIIQCEEICFHQQNIIAAVGAQIHHCVEATSVDPDTINSGGDIIISNHPDHNPQSYHHTTTTINTSNNNIEEEKEDNSDSSNNFALALGGRDDFFRQDNILGG